MELASLELAQLNLIELKTRIMRSIDTYVVNIDNTILK